MEGTITVTANTSIDDDSQTVTIADEDDHQDNVDFTLLDGDVGGQVLSCGPTDTRCGDGSPVADATVTILGMDHLEIENYFDDVDSPDEAREKARELREELSDFDLEESIEEEFDIDFDWSPSDLVSEFDDANAEYVAVHPGRAWADAETDGFMGYEYSGDWSGVSMLPSTLFASSDGALDEPVMHLEPDESHVLSIWDATADNADTGLVSTSDIDKSLPGATTGGTIEIEKLGPGGETISSATTSTIDFLEESHLIGSDKTHEAVPRRGGSFSEGIYRLTPEGSDFSTYLMVGSPSVSDVMPGWGAEVEDEAGDLLEKAARLEELMNADVLEVTHVQANEDGYYQADLPETTETVAVTAAHAGDFLDADALADPDTPGHIADALFQAEEFDVIGDGVSTWEDLEGIDAADNVESLEDAIATLENVESADDIIQQFDEVNELGERFAAEFDGKLYIPRAEEQADVPARVDPKVTEISAAQFLEDFENLEDLLAEDFEAFLDEDILGLLDEWGIPVDELEDIDDEVAEAIEERAEELIDYLEGVDLDDDALEDIEDELDVIDDGELNVTDPVELEIEELVDSVQELEAIVSQLTEVVDDEESELDLSNNILSGEFPFPGTIDDVTVLVTYADGEAEVIPDDYWHIESASSVFNPFDDAEKVVVDGYEVSEDRPNPRLMVDANVDSELMRQEERVENPAYAHDIPRLTSIDVSTLFPATGERVEVTPRAASGTGFVGVVDATVLEGQGTTLNHTIEHNETVVFRPENETEHTVQIYFENNAGDEFREVVTVSVDNSRSQSYPTVRLDGAIPIAADDLREVSLDTSGETASLTANIGSSDSLPELHIRNADSVGVDAWDIEIVRGSDEQQVREHVSLFLYVDLEVGEDLIWSQEGPITADGETQYGDYFNGTIRAYTDERGQAEIEVVRDPDIFARFNHWRQVRFGGLPLVGGILSFSPSLPTLFGTGTGVVLALFAARRRWFV